MVRVVVVVVVVVMVVLLSSNSSSRQTRDVPFSPNSITPTSRNFPVSRTLQESRHSGIWALADAAAACRSKKGHRLKAGLVVQELTDLYYNYISP